jgi:hypothetical protein
MKARIETNTETSNVYFKKMIYMRLYIDLSEKDFLLLKGSMLANFFHDPAVRFEVLTEILTF